MGSDTFDRDVVFMKLVSLDNCLVRIQELAVGKKHAFDDMGTQESVILNLQRAIQLCIDIGAHIIKSNGWRAPATLKETFLTLKEHKIIERELCDLLCKMIGFRNIAIHDYQKINVEVLEGVVKNHMGDFRAFKEAVSNFVSSK